MLYNTTVRLDTENHKLEDVLGIPFTSLEYVEFTCKFFIDYEGLEIIEIQDVILVRLEDNEDQDEIIFSEEFTRLNIEEILYWIYENKKLEGILYEKAEDIDKEEQLELN